MNTMSYNFKVSMGYTANCETMPGTYQLVTIQHASSTYLLNHQLRIWTNSVLC